MNQVKLNELIQEEKVVLPLYFLRMYKDFNVSLDEFILLAYLYNKDKIIFNPEKISDDLKSDLFMVMQCISNLEDKGLVSVNTIKNERGIMEEVLNINPLFTKITQKLVEELNVKEKEEINIHELVEREFNRRLSPLEHEVIDEWERNNFSKELIKEAVREASINGVNNLRYIDKILVDWSKKGIQKPDDIKKEIKEEKGEPQEVFKYDWLNENEEI